MDHTAWTARDGGPINAYGFAQDKDGSLWILSQTGLYNFDGMKFSAFSPHSPKSTVSLAFIRTLFVDDHGCLWLGSEIRGIAQVCDRLTSRVFDESDGLPSGQVKEILQAPNGGMMAVARDRLVELRDGRWSDYPENLAFPPESVVSAFFDHTGKLFVMANKAIWQQESGRGTKFRKLPTPGGFWGNFVERPDGSVWAMSNVPDRKAAWIERVSVDGAPPTISQRIVVDASMFISDARGGFWIAGDEGVVHSSPASGSGQTENSPLDTYTHFDGLSSTGGVDTVFIDRSGTLWAGTTAGIDRFTDTPLMRFLDKRLSLNPQLAVCPSGDTWVASYQTVPFSVRGDVVTDHGASRNSVALFCDRDGVVWLTDQQGLFRYQAEDIRAISTPPGIAPQLLRKIEGKNEHSLFVSITRHGLWTYRDGIWAPFSAPGFPDITPISLYEDSHDRLWAGFIDDRIAVLKDGVGHTYGSAKPSPLGEVQVFLDSSMGLLAAGTNGLAVFKVDHFESLLLEDTNAARGISGLLQAANGDLWLNGLHGVVRIPAAEVSKSYALPAYHMYSEKLNEGASTGPSSQLVGLPSAVAGGEGRFWFSTSTALFSLDPKLAAKDPELPRLSRLSLNVDAMRVESGTKVAHGEHTVRIGYLGVYLPDPQKVIYKYKLDGIDTNWQDVGTRTEAVYTGLRPGNYLFRVVASTGYGRWTAEDDSIRFTMLPAFYQTVWFDLACLLAFGAGLWILVRLRAHTLAHDIRRRAEERADERIRIARDLHDTLLQGVQGLMLRFHAAAQEVSAGGGARKNLDEALEAADRVLVEARDRVSRLRADAPPEMDIAARLKAVGDDLNYEKTVTFKVTTHGKTVALSPQILDEMYFIGREALANAFRHSDATAITVTITYAWAAVTFNFADNGCGFHPYAPGQQAGHWGISGMMERAHRIGAKFECRSAPGSGTAILISVPMHRSITDAILAPIRRLFRR